jgi:murein DD-endopeptidase MepM/ murein hydrolase activator NlpD
MELLKKAKNISAFAHDPLGFITDAIVIMVVNLIIPIPLVGQAVARFKKPVLLALATIFILGLFLLLTVGTVLMTPLLMTSGYLHDITSAFTSTSSVAADTGFIDTSVPHQNPLGGSGLSFATITAYFMDSAYYLQFGKAHTGVDLVPSSAYFTNSESYKTTGKVNIFSTINGKVNYYIDSEGGETVEVTNQEGFLKVVFIHFSSVYVQSGDTIKAGTPIGIMGDTGFATGAHVHYEVRTKDGDSWLAVNPLGYIK